MIAKSYKFNFRDRKIKNEAGEVVTTGKKQAPISADLPVPGSEDIITMLQNGGAAAQYLLDVVADSIYQAARGQLAELAENAGDEPKEYTVNDFDFAKLTISYLSSIPPAQRGSTALTEEDWEVFYTDYKRVMIAATGKEERRINNQIDLFKKPGKIRKNKGMLAALLEQIDIYLTSSQALDDTGVAAERLVTKFTKWRDEPEEVVDRDCI